MKKIISCVVIGCLSLSSWALSDSNYWDSHYTTVNVAYPQNTGPSESKKKNEFSLAYEYSDYIYREPHMDYPIKDSGTMHGISAAYTLRSVMEEAWGPNDNFLSVELIYMTGKVDYEGWLQDGYGNVTGPAYSNGIHDWYLDGRLLFGQRFTLKEDRLFIDPFAGLAYRFLRDEGHKKSDTAYLRESNYFYAPLGANLVWQITDSFKMVLKGEFDWLLSGKQKSGMSRFDPLFSDMTNTQKKGVGARASVKLEQELGKIAVFVEPFYRFWKIQNSEQGCYYKEDLGGGYYMCYGGIEPFNTTREYGLRAGVTF